jgi:hypothetical protein
MLDGATFKYAVWFESCFNDDGKLIRFIFPSAKSVDSVALATGGGHLLHPCNLLALYDPDDSLTYPSIYLEP